MNNIQIRSANIADLNSLLKLEEEFDSDKINKNSFRYFLSKKSPCIFLAETKERKVCGYILFLTRLNSKKARIYSFIVDSSFRSHGIGNLLFERTIKMFVKTAFYLEVKVSNKNAINFYKNIGFTITKTIENYYEDGTNAYKMELYM